MLTEHELEIVAGVTYLLTLNKHSAIRKGFNLEARITQVLFTFIKEDADYFDDETPLKILKFFDQLANYCLDERTKDAQVFALRAYYLSASVKAKNQFFLRDKTIVFREVIENIEDCER